MLKKEWCRQFSLLLLFQICPCRLWLEVLWVGPNCCVPSSDHLIFTASIVANSLEARIHRHRKLSCSTDQNKIMSKQEFVMYAGDHTAGEPD